MKKNILYLFFMLSFLSALRAQSYDTSLGMRLGTDWGLTLQQRIAHNITLEMIFQNSFRRDESMATLMVERHIPFLTKRLNLYVGGGVHKGWGPGLRSGADDYRDPFGLTIISGLELTIARINLSYDIKPALNFVGGDNFLYVQTGLSVRYVLIRQGDLLGNTRKRKRQRRRKRNGRNWRFWEN